MEVFKTTFIPIFESIRMKSTDFLLQCCNLTEVYHDLNFTKKEAINSLILVKDNTSDTDQNQILDELNNEFLGVGLYFEKINISKLRNTYPEAGIVSAEYNPEDSLTHIYISDIFINNLLNENFEILADGIVAVSTHEDTHRQQFSISKGKLKGTPSELFPINTEYKTKIYLGNTTEIDAHAREAAIYLYNLNLTGKDLVNKLINNDKILLKSQAYFQYWEIFGKATLIKGTLDEDAKERLRVWRRFLKRIIAYLLTTNKYKFTINAHLILKKLDEIQSNL